MNELSEEEKAFKRRLDSDGLSAEYHDQYSDDDNGAELEDEEIRQLELLEAYSKRFDSECEEDSDESDNNRIDSEKSGQSKDTSEEEEKEEEEEEEEEEKEEEEEEEEENNEDFEI